MVATLDWRMRSCTAVIRLVETRCVQHVSVCVSVATPDEDHARCAVQGAASVFRQAQRVRCAR
jgi:hypothetical protein